MDEDVLAVVGLDEPEALFDVVPLHFSGRHDALSCDQKTMVPACAGAFLT